MIIATLTSTRWDGPSSSSLTVQVHRIPIFFYAFLVNIELRSEELVNCQSAVNIPMNRGRICCQCTQWDQKDRHVRNLSEDIHRFGTRLQYVFVLMYFYYRYL